MRSSPCCRPASMSPTSTASRVFGDAPKTAILIDCSTIDVATAKAVEEEAQAQGYTMVDAPVSGGIAAAEGGTLTFMVGGSDEGFEKAREYLEKMGKAVIHAGDAGAGQAAKICNNMLLGATMAATCEAFVLAQKLGLDPKVFFDISSKASGQSWSMTSYCPVPGVGPETPADREYEGGFAAALMLKDLKLAMEAAQKAGAYTPMGGEAEELYQRFVDLGGGGKDFSALIKMIDDSWARPRARSMSSRRYRARLDPLPSQEGMRVASGEAAWRPARAAARGRKLTAEAAAATQRRTSAPPVTGA